MNPTCGKSISQPSLLSRRFRTSFAWHRNGFAWFHGDFASGFAVILPDFAAISQVSRRFCGFRGATMKYELQNARTEVWGSGNHGEKILQPC